MAKRKIKNRNIFLVYLFTIITFGIYGIYWMVSTKNDINSLGAKIPTAWLMIIPIINIFWMFKYLQGYTKVMKKDEGFLIVLVVVWLVLGFLLPGIIQYGLNKKSN
jgi:hypothetical protein